MNRTQKHRHLKTAWCLIVGSVATCTVAPGLAAVMMFGGVSYAVAIEFYCHFKGMK